MMLLLAASLLFTNPAPLEMPRAEGYLVTDNGHQRLEDRYHRLDLWLSRTIDGRWIDDDGRVFILAHLNVQPPFLRGGEATVTRQDALKVTVPIDRRDPLDLRDSLTTLTRLHLDKKGVPPRQMPRGYEDVRYWQGTNENAIVCTWRRKKSDLWEVGIWRLIEGDEIDYCQKIFEEEIFETKRTPPWPGVFTGLSERELLRADARHSVTNYNGWHVTETPHYSILDDLPNDQTFVTAFTNDIARLRPAFVTTFPPCVDASNSLSIVRIFADRSEYLEALEADGLTNMAWSAAYWSPARRELVAYLPSDGKDKLLQTLRHESFHQYLSYATSFIAVSPWLNEGYAQFFENPENESCGERFDALSEEELERLSEWLPSLFMSDYLEFYSGTDEERALKYALAKSVVIFLERGASNVRFDPFRDLRKLYFKELLDSQDMKKATTAAFQNEKLMKLFVTEWFKFWKER